MLKKNRIIVDSAVYLAEVIVALNLLWIIFLVSIRGEETDITRR